MDIQLYNYGGWVNNSPSSSLIKIALATISLIIAYKFFRALKKDEEV